MFGDVTRNDGADDAVFKFQRDDGRIDIANVRKLRIHQRAAHGVHVSLPGGSSESSGAEVSQEALSAVADLLANDPKRVAPFLESLLRKLYCAGEFFSLGSP